MRCGWLITLGVVFPGVSACVTADGPSGYSERVLTIASLDMFSQQEGAEMSNPGAVTGNFAETDLI